MSNVKINLLPPEIKKKRAAEKGFVLLTGVMVIVIGICSLITGFLYMKAANEVRILESKTMKITAIESEINKYSIYKKRQDEVNTHKSALNKALENEVYWHRFINEISMIVPSDVTFNSMELDETGKIKIDAFSFNYESVAELLVRFTDLDMVKNIWLPGVKVNKYRGIKMIGSGDSSSSSSSSSSDQSYQGVDFTLEATLNLPGDTGNSGSAGSKGASNGKSSG